MGYNNESKNVAFYKQGTLANAIPQPFYFLTTWITIIECSFDK